MRCLFFLFLCCSPFLSKAQQELNYPTAIYGPENIMANWVSHPDIEGGEDRIVLFRNTFDVDDPTPDFIINISADNHYFLYVNGEMITHGPQLGDIRHWKYETLNLNAYLHKGKNAIAVKVVNFGKRRFFGFQSIHTSLMINGITKNARKVTTRGYGDGWKSALDNSYKAIEVLWRGQGKKTIIGGFYANNPTDFVDKNKYPTNWEQLDFDDTQWKNTVFFEGARSMGGSMAYILEPRNLPLLTWQKEAIGKIVRFKNLKKTTFPVSGELIIPPNQKVSFLVDQKMVTNGFPELVFSKGKGASIKIKYAENLFGKNNEKGDRNDLEGKELIGYYDQVISNGKDLQQFTPNWMRTFRFIEFEIETLGQGLTLHTFFNYRSRAKIPSIAEFTSDNETYNQIFDICKRTVDICTQDYFLSDAYYETMQYVGDTKVHALIWQSMSGNLKHTENALQQFHHSRDAEGNILGAYPLRSTFIFPTYSLVWVDMIADYFHLTGDLEVIHDYKDGIIHTLGGFEKNMNTKNLVNKTPYRYFVDWYTGPNAGGGTATNNDGENSAVVTLHYVHALQRAARLLEAIGDQPQARKYKTRAEDIKKSVYRLCFDTKRGLFAERPDKSVYDQHTNIMAILTDAIGEERQKDLLGKILEEPDLLQATYYYRFYLFEAIKKVDVPELFVQAQKPWEEMIADNMTTTLERFESEQKPTRSEVHPWSASPAYFYFDYLAGIQSVSNNFERVRIAPKFGELNKIKGLLPTSKGNILFDLRRSQTMLYAEITIPESMTGELVWHNTNTPLKPGKHKYSLK